VCGGATHLSSLGGVLARRCAPAAARAAVRARRRRPRARAPPPRAPPPSSSTLAPVVRLGLSFQRSAATARCQQAPSSAPRSREPLRRPALVASPRPPRAPCRRRPLHAAAAFCAYHSYAPPFPGALPAAARVASASSAAWCAAAPHARPAAGRARMGLSMRAHAAHAPLTRCAPRAPRVADAACHDAPEAL